MRSLRNMSTPIETNALSSFLDALKEVETPTMPEIEHRVYYDEVTRVCTIKTTEKPPGKYVVVPRDEYELVHFCPNFFVTSQGRIEKIPTDFTSSPNLKKDSNGEFKTIKNNIIFAVDDSYSGEVDHWRTKGLIDE